MQFANPLEATDNSVRLKPTPKAHGLCPVCKQKVQARCGKIRIWHWAHEKGANAVTHGGKTKRSGIAAGKRNFLRTGERCCFRMKLLGKFIVPM